MITNQSEKDIALFKRAKDILNAESLAVKNLIQFLDQSLVEALVLLEKTEGKIICTGIGKPAFIAKKIAATFSSTGSPACYLNPAEAIHGDIGFVRENDIVLVFSYSGESEEVTRLIPLIQRTGAPLIAITGNKKSTLAQHSDVVLNVFVEKEACSLGLAPSSSSTAALAMGDTLAILLYERKGFAPEDFSQYHPGGELGRKLLLKTEDVMRDYHKSLLIQKNLTVRDALTSLSDHNSSAIIVTDENKHLKGIFTDGDLRRLLLQKGDLNLLSIEEVMTTDPICVYQKDLAVKASALIRDNKIDELPVVDNKGCIVGLIDIQDLLSVGIV